MDATVISALDAVRAPIGAANGLPNAFYTDPEIFAREAEIIFSKGWACIGFGKDAPEPGDAVPVTFLGQPYLVVRDRDGTLRVFQNVCRHRGMVLVDEPRKLGSAIRCPYHSWCYNLDGSLRTTPHVGGPGRNLHESIDRSALGLNQVRSHVLMDMVFINLSGDAPDFTEYTQDLRARWSEFVDQPLTHGGSRSSFTLEVATNWKLAVENYCESYHLPWVHPGLNSYSKLEDHYNIVRTDTFSGQGTTVYNPDLGNPERAFRDFDGLSEKWSAGAEYIALYPNVLLGVHRDHVFSIMLDPKAPDRTVERIEIYYADPEMAAPEWDSMRDIHSRMWMDVFKEDIFVVEGMQKGRAAALFDGGKFSPVMDEATHCFHAWVAGRF